MTGLTQFVRGCVSGVTLLVCMSLRLVPSPHVITGIVCCALPAVAQEEARQSYSLPRGDAATTLRQFAGASGRQIIFMMDKVRGEQTNAIAGEFSPREA